MLVDTPKALDHETRFHINSNSSFGPELQNQIRHRAPTVTGVVGERQMLPASQLYRGPWKAEPRFWPPLSHFEANRAFCARARAPTAKKWGTLPSGSLPRLSGCLSIM